MNILEDQVTDLNSLAGSPPISMMMSGETPLSMSGSPTAAEVEGGKKRKADEGPAGAGAAGGSAQQTRAKRNRYISIACNECKRRKIKCNGETPCLRCGNLNLECQYAPNCCSNGSFKDSDEFRQMNAHIKSLQEQVDNLYTSMKTLRNNPDNLGFAHTPERGMSHGPLPPISPVARYRPVPKHASFRGPTSTAFSLAVAKTTLHSMGYQGLGDEGVGTQDPTPIASPPPIQYSPQLSNLLENPSRDPLWIFNKEEMVRLCRVYEEEIGIMYPIVDIEQVISHGRNLYNYGANLKPNHTNSNGQLDDIRDLDSCVLKLILASATITENSGHSDLGNSLFENVREIADRILHTEAIDVRSIPFLVLVAIYHFHCDEEALAWRIIGQVARMCIELGLHRRDSLFRVVPDDEDRSKVIRLFWSIYVLDRRWSFGTGMPFALQDADIDPSLPEPSIDVPYLNVMIAYSRIGSKVWRSICSFAPPLAPPLNVEEIGYLDYQIIQWQKSIPADLQLPTTAEPKSSSRALHRLQILLYLRANQMRILIYRPVLHSASSIQENMNYANIVVELAKDTIRALTHLNLTTDIYRMQQVLFNYFLISALAVIFLASCHAPVHFSSLCRTEFYMALDLVKGFSNKSWVSKRLWKTIKGLKEVGPRLGLCSPDNILNNGNVNGIGGGMEDPHSSAALAMAGLAGHEISGLTAAHGHFSHDGSNHPGVSITNNGRERERENGSSPIDGFQMSHEMTNLFEAALGSVGLNGNGNMNGNGNGNGTSHGVGSGYASTPGLGHDGVDGTGMNGGIGSIGSNVFGGDEELYRQLRDLF